MAEPRGEQYKPVAEAVRPESKMNFKLGEVIEGNLTRAITESLEGRVSGEEVKKWVGDAERCYTQLLTEMGNDKERGIRNSKWVYGLGSLSGEEKALAAGCFMAASLGLDIMGKDKESALAKFVQQAKDRSVWKARFGLLTNKLTNMMHGDGGSRGAMGVGTTERRFGMIAELATLLVNFKEKNELDYYEAQTFHTKVGNKYVNVGRRQIGESFNEGHFEKWAAAERAKTAMVQLQTERDKGEMDEDKYREQLKVLNSLRSQVGVSKMYLQDTMIWYCMGKYRTADKLEGRPKTRTMAEKVGEVKDRVRGWFGIKEKRDKET